MQKQKLQLADAAIVEQIHSDFHTAEARLITVAEQLVHKKDKILEKQKRASLLGFSSSHKRVVEKVNEVDEVKRRIDYYREKYPLNKFITHEEVKRLCKKWGLVLGDAHLFIGEIPERNLQEIEKFNLKKEDWVFGEGSVRSRIDDFEVRMEPRMSWDGRVFEQEVTVRGVRSFAQLRELEREVWGMMAGEPRGLRDDWSPGSRREVSKPAFKIVAPEKDFETTGYMIQDNELVEQPPVYDPIVLQPVKGGYLIITAWGPEASDELVINQIFN